MSIDPDEQHARSDLASTLRRLRKAAGLSGERLAVRCAMSQSKISRIESGKTLPSVQDVERMLSALDVPPDAARELLVLARQANVQHTSWRAVAEIGIWRKQAELNTLSESATVQRQFLPGIPSGLLQVPDYARAALSPIVASSPARDVDKAVLVRLGRQNILEDVSRRFIFVLTEQAVRWRRAGRSVMARQCEHMAEVSERPNVELAIVPLSAGVPGAPRNMFVIYDERLVLVELFSGEVVLHDYRDIAHHLELFEFFYSRALTGDRARAFLLTVRDEYM